MEHYDQLQVREVFHLEFLRRFGRALKMENYAIKGGVNLRFFFKSLRYSEDMDLDVRNTGVFELKEAVMKIIENRSFKDNLKPFGIADIVAPDMTRAKQTETTQRFKIHIISNSGEDLFTKVEFSRRGFSGNTVVNGVNDTILREYKMAPLLAPHYDAASAVAQKIGALADRTAVQARDIFDLYILGSQYAPDKALHLLDDKEMLKKAYERVFEVEFEQFRDAVVSYLSPDDQAVYANPASWEEVRLKAANIVEEALKAHG